MAAAVAAAEAAGRGDAVSGEPPPKGGPPPPLDSPRPPLRRGHRLFCRRPQPLRVGLFRRRAAAPHPPPHWRRAGWAGHSAAHWAALDGSTMLLELLLLADPTAVDTPSASAAQGGQTPLMWAAVGGRLQATLLLLQRGAPPWARATRGLRRCRARGAVWARGGVVRAARRGRRRAGRRRGRPHAAALGGVHGAPRGGGAAGGPGGAPVAARDRKGMTPLLRAAERGHALPVLGLLAAGADAGEGHDPRRCGVGHVGGARRGRAGGAVRGPPRPHRRGWVAALGRRRLWGVPLRQLPVVMGYWATLAASLVVYFGWVVRTLGRAAGPRGLHPGALLAASAASLATGARTTFADPGRLPRGTAATFRRRLDRSLAAASTPPAVRHGDVADSVAADAPAVALLSPSRFCYTCLAPRAARSKHDATTDACVARFDHYCPWVGAPVGAANHRWLLAFGVATLTAQALFLGAAGRAVWVSRGGRLAVATAADASGGVAAAAGRPPPRCSSSSTPSLPRLWRASSPHKRSSLGAT
ncbi:hypothetical protein BU14_0580s0016 [Porphyra umbilicalis]|uniref:Palmitoyltransferase n=1 Tax=Porphyra umbilicalis TaxID=2786 RepID=A0A1X6NRI4_PORUM|nr:hypothetical protein BU14_0580s0016 [Porphyra umbilicalis]|eukprot:OSX71192.1 hypothetical protein BU14_0580s0016 [Porphyra umbilicalis]